MTLATAQYNQQFRWYDANWLSSYVRATEFLRDHYPSKLADFRQAFEPLRTDPEFEVQSVPRCISPEDHASLKQLVPQLQAQELERHEVLQFGRLVVHDHPLVTRIQKSLVGLVSDLAGQQLELSYNFLSLYNNLGICRVHLDEPSAKWTLDYCIEQSDEWPIHLSQVRPWPEDWTYAQDDWEKRIKDDPANRFTPYVLREQEAILFAGSSQWHYRDRIVRKSANNYCQLVFFHFIPTGCGDLLRPKRWSKLFGVPELADLIIENAVVDTTTIA